MISAAVMLALQPPPEVTEPMERVPFMLIVCGAPGLPTLTLDNHNSHRLVRFAELGANEVSFDLINPEFTGVWVRSAPNRGFRVSANGVTQRTVGIGSGTRASIELVVHLDEANTWQHSYTIRAGQFRRDFANCTWPPAPRVHPADSARP